MPETRESLGKYQDFPRPKSDFPHPKSHFPQWLSNFRQWLSAFLNGFLLSSTAFRFSSTAFHFPRNPRKSIYGSKYPKDCYWSFVFPATCSPSVVIPTTMSTSPPTNAPPYINLWITYVILLLWYVHNGCARITAECERLTACLQSTRRVRMHALQSEGKIILI